MPEFLQAIEQRQLAVLEEFACVEKRAATARAFFNVQPGVMRHFQARQRRGLAFWAMQFGVFILRRTDSSVTVIQALSPLELLSIVPLEDIEPNPVTARATLDRQRSHAHCLELGFAFGTAQPVIALPHGDGSIEGLEGQLARAVRIHDLQLRDQRL